MPGTTSSAPIALSHSSSSAAARPAAFGRAPQGTQYSIRTWRRPAIAVILPPEAGSGLACRSGAIERRLADDFGLDVAVLSNHVAPPSQDTYGPYQSRGIRPSGLGYEPTAPAR